MTARSPQLALVVGAARSGTTLLRLLLDAHPEIGCPAEAGLPALMSHMARVWETIDADVRVDAGVMDPGEEPVRLRDAQRDPTEPFAQQLKRKGRDTVGAEQDLTAAAKDWIRATASVAMHRYLERGEQKLYVDKSLDSVFHLSLVEQLFPATPCVLVFRHVMDTIASGLEASPWGFSAFGYAPYVAATPTNTVVALARYWLDHVTLALAWEKEQPQSCLRVRYDDLVTEPEQVVLGIQRFLGVREDLDVLERTFHRRPARGPGDYKVEYTSGVHTDSIGRGKRVPLTMLPPSLLEALNEQLVALEYAPLDRSWNTAGRAYDVAVGDVWTRRLQELMDEVHIPEEVPGIGPFAIVAEDQSTLRWVIDPATGAVLQGDGEVEVVLTGTTEDLVLMLTGEENLGVLFRAGRIRHVAADADDIVRADIAKDLNLLVRTLRRSTVDGGAALAGERR